MTKRDVSLSLIALALTLVCLSAFSPGKCFGQIQPESEREKVHLHFDKPSYIAGDTIWFKAYVVMAGSNTPTMKSKVLYVDVIDDHQKIIRSLLLKLSSGLANGDIILPDTLLNNGLHIRTYTNWMKNWGAAAYFDKTIPIINGVATSPNMANSGLSPDTGKTDIGFFPEGGDLVMGLRSKIGVKATGSNGLGEEASGEIVDQFNKTVASFKTANTGIGAFPLTPTADKKYTAIVKLNNGRTLRLPIPPARLRGYVLTVNNRVNDSISVNIALSDALLGQSVILQAQTDQMVYYSAKMKPNGPLNNLMISRDELPSGIVRLTLLSAINEPLAERLVFNTTGNDLQLKIVTKNSYAPGEKATLEVADTEGNPLTGSFSMAITSQEKVPVNEDNQLTIQANLLLVSDLKGTIEHPNYYFNAKNAADSTERHLQLDNLLLTQGWRRFVWKKSADDSVSKPTFAPEDGLQIGGKLLTSAKKPIAKSKVSIYATIDGLPFLADTLTGSDGSFKFNDLDFDDGTKFVIQAKDVKNKNDVRIVLDTAAAEQATRYVPLSDNSPSKVYLATSQARIKELAAFRLSRKTIQLKQVNITAKKPVKSGMPGGAAFALNVINNDKIKGYIDLKSVIQQANPLIRFNGDNEPIYEPMDPNSGGPKTGRIGFHKNFVTMVDGALTADNYLLQAISPEDVESIEIYKDGTSVGVLNKGVIAINTKKKDGQFYRGRIVPGMLTFLSKGYLKTREFYLPKYVAKSDKPDLRDVIYWNPNVIIENSNKAEIEFYNSNSLGNYDITVEGITTDGRIARTTYTYSVK
jgi:hypothetical protein